MTAGNPALLAARATPMARMVSGRLTAVAGFTNTGRGETPHDMRGASGRAGGRASAMTDHGPVPVVLPPQTAAREDRGSLLADGLMEDVCLEMARFPAMRVISWMSGAAVAHLPDREIGERLDATHVLRTRVKPLADRWWIAAATRSSGYQRLPSRRRHSHDPGRPAPPRRAGHGAVIRRQRHSRGIPATAPSHRVSE